MTSSQCNTHVAQGRYVNVDNVVHELKEEEQASHLELGQGLWCQVPFSYTIHMYLSPTITMRIHVGTQFDHLKQLAGFVYGRAVKHVCHEC